MHMNVNMQGLQTNRTEYDGLNRNACIYALHLANTLSLFSILVESCNIYI
jgi:hypothetical protein